MAAYALETRYLRLWYSFFCDNVGRAIDLSEASFGRRQEHFRVPWLNSAALIVASISSFVARG